MKRLKVIACEVSFRELSFCASKVDNIIDFTFMPRKLHIVGSKNMRETLQSEIDNVDIDKYDAILLAYGLCGCGVVGLTSELPIIIPKAHDCISFLLGSREKYSDLKMLYPKAFYFSSGWIERDIIPNDNTLSESFDMYKSMIDDVIFINTSVGNIGTYRSEINEFAKNLEANYTEINGDGSLLFNFLNGDWDEDYFTIVEPDCEIMATNDDNIIGFKI